MFDLTKQVEGGLIDYAHHRGLARAALDETIAFEAAVQTAINLLQARGILDSTLIIVTSDHAHSLAINGNPPRGNNILGTILLIYIVLIENLSRLWDMITYTKTKKNVFITMS